MKNQDLDNTSLAERVRRKQEIFWRLDEARQELEAADVKPMSLDEIAEAISEMREERMNELVPDLRD